MGKSKLLIIIPAYNEEECIEQVISRLEKEMPQFDYVIVNDGSKDGTSRICHERGFNVIDLPMNLGLSGAFQTGMKYAYKNGYECAIQIDADGQHKPEYIQKLLECLEEGNDIAIGSRFVTEKKPWSSRMLGSRLIEGAIWLTTGKKIKDPTSGMRMYSSKILEDFATEINITPEPDTISYLMKSGARVGEVQVEMEERLAGESYLNFTKSLLYMFHVLSSILIIQTFRTRRHARKPETEEMRKSK